MQTDQFIYRDDTMAEIVKQAAKAARGSANILIEGAPGTGKTTLARFIHAHTDGARGVTTLHCAAVDAADVDLVQPAENTTLFLHDVCDLAPPAQAALAMAVRQQPGRRIIAASSRPLRQAVEAGQFHQGLFYQLSVISISLPPLAERPNDIAILAGHFADVFASAHQVPMRPLRPDALAKLAAHHWPGNVRELENVIQRAVLFADGPDISARDIALPNAPQGEGRTASPGLVGRTVADVERELILHTLEHCGGNRTQAAEILGISVRTLRNKLRQYLQDGADVTAFSHAA